MGIEEAGGAEEVEQLVDGDVAAVVHVGVAQSHHQVGQPELRRFVDAAHLHAAAYAAAVAHQGTHLAPGGERPVR